MSSFRSPSSVANTLRFANKSSSYLDSASLDDHSYGFEPSSSSPFQSSSPLRTPTRISPSHEYSEWQAGGNFGDSDATMHDRREKVEYTAHLWQHRASPVHPSYKQLPLPSLMTKFPQHTRQSDALSAYCPSPISSPFQTSFCPQESNVVRDDCEEYDLESMDIHIHETYFTTSAERGRWLSSPIAPRVRSRAPPPMRGHSSPVKGPADASPTKECLRRRAKSCFIDEKPLSLGDYDEIPRCSSSLPPSSPPTSPMSSLSFLGDDGEYDSAVDPRSNPYDCRSHTGTPELSISSTACTSPIESARTPSPRKPSCIIHSDLPLSSPGPVTSISRPSSSRPDQSPRLIDSQVQALAITSLEREVAPPPLSQCDLELAQEPSKQPLSDKVNKPHPGQDTTSPGTIMHAILNQDTFSGPCSNGKGKRKRESIARDMGPRKKKRAATRDRVNDSNLSSKKIKSSRSSETDGTKSLSRRGMASKAKRRSSSPSRSSIEEAPSAPAHDREAVKPTDHAQTQRPGSDLSLMNMLDAEFHTTLTGVLIEAFATSRATSMDLSTLYSVLIQTHPNLAAERSKEELLAIIAAVLEAGRIRCGMFDKVDSSGERSRHKTLENRWFYVPEQDEDRERALLISAIMPRQKRNETKKYKQYYWRPLDKICRWDPEDAP